MASRSLQIVVDLKDRASKQLRGISGQIEKTGEKFKKAGGTMTRGLTLPLVGAAGAAVKFSSDFEESLKQTRAQAGLTSDEMDKVGEAVENIASKTGESMDEIFEAQTLAQSSTLDLAEANELVEVAALSAASGLGEMKTIVNLGTTVAQKFSGDVSDATEGIEIMAAAAQQSQTSVDQFADGLLKGSAGMDILGISMREGSTIFSRLSDSAANAEVAGTQFRSMLAELQKPSKELGGQMMDTFGSVEQFRKELDENSIEALFKLKEGAEASGTSVEELMGNVRSAAGASNFFASDLETVNETLESTENSTGIINEMFKDSESFTRLLSRAFNTLKTSIKPVGDIIVQRLSPILADLIERMRAVSDWFQGLSERQQNLILAFVGLLAVIGPLLVMLGTLATLISSISAPVVIVVGVIGGLIAVLKKLSDENISLMEVWDSLRESVDKFLFYANVLWEYFKDLIRPATENLKIALSDLFSTISDFWNKWGEVIMNGFKALAGIIGTVLFGAVVGATTVIQGLVIIIAKLTEGLIWAFEKFIEFSFWIKDTAIPTITNLGETITNVIEKSLEGWANFFSGIRDYLNRSLEGWKNFGDALAEIFRSIKERALGFIDPVAKRVERVLDLINRVRRAAGAKASGAMRSVRSAIPGLAEGGIVTGPTTALIGEAGPEAVIPLDRLQATGGQTTVNITVNGDVSGEELVRKVKDKIARELNREIRL